jgi:hypothetical protein
LRFVEGFLGGKNQTRGAHARKTGGVAGNGELSGRAHALGNGFTERPFGLHIDTDARIVQALPYRDRTQSVGVGDAPDEAFRPQGLTLRARQERKFVYAELRHELSCTRARLTKFARTLLDGDLDQRLLRRVRQRSVIARIAPGGLHVVRQQLAKHRPSP